MVRDAIFSGGTLLDEILDGLALRNLKPAEAKTGPVTFDMQDEHLHNSRRQARAIEHLLIEHFGRLKDA